MFINALAKQNPELIQAAYNLWRQGKLLPDTYVIDVDRVMSNAKRLLDVANRHGIQLYLMTKQFGRNPWLAGKLIELGYQGAVVVDFKEARTLMSAGIPVSHAGHLVQIPTSMVPGMVAQRPEVITVFSLEKAQEISQAAQNLGVIQNIMLKVFDRHDYLYPGQEAGIALEKLESVAQRIRALPGVRLTGLTHFPCLLWDEAHLQMRPTANLDTLLRAKATLRQIGIDIEQVNAPSATSCATLPLLAARGVTHAEPGHALTGTIPCNTYGDQPESIGMLYITEVSHHFGGNSYCYGGGLYRRGHATNARVFCGADGGALPALLLPQDESSIDYHFVLAGEYPVGSMVAMCFRTQIFVTRSDVALVSGIHAGAPVLEGVYDSLGSPVASYPEVANG